MTKSGSNVMHVRPEHQPIMRQIGLDAEAIFTHPDIRPWRTLSDRENCTLDATVDGRAVRLHVKRYPPARAKLTPAEMEVAGIELLNSAGVATVPLVAWGKLEDGRSFMITEDLTGFEPADKLVASGFSFDKIAEPTAALTAQLHDAGLHHRDLYLCHFFVKRENPCDVRLIDPARVRPLPRWFSKRWIVKDLSQFWYSMIVGNIEEPQRRRWMNTYASRRGLRSINSMLRGIRFKVKIIAWHDARLNAKQPGRNIPIPD